MYFIELFIYDCEHFKLVLGHDYSNWFLSILDFEKLRKIDANKTF